MDETADSRGHVPEETAHEDRKRRIYAPAIVLDSKSNRRRYSDGLVRIVEVDDWWQSSDSSSRG